MKRLALANDGLRTRIVSGLLILFVVGSCTHIRNQALEEKYTCPMHPEIVRNMPGTCPICFMDLVKVGDTTGADGSIMLNESQIKLANITTAPAVKKELTIETRLNGKVAVNQNQSEVISSRVQGRIERLFFKEIGQRVQKGEPLYEIYSEQLLTLQKEYLLALRQVEELKEKRFASFLSASERKLLQFGMTGDQVLHLAKQKQIDSRIVFFAPASGIIATLDVAEGQYVSEGSALCRIEKLDKLWVEAELYLGETSAVRSGEKVRVEMNGFEDDPRNGTVIFLSPEFRQGNQIITLRVEINNPEEKFIPGMQGIVIIQRSGKNTLVLPLDAVIRDRYESHVWIKKEDGTFGLRSVKTGEETADEIEVTEGLEEKENVVITGAYLLYSELVLKKGWNPNQHNP